MKQILLVEDERHKREELTGFLNEYFEDQLAITHVDSVRSAFLAVTDARFDLIVLDMALPTFSAGENNSARGLDQALGGVEVLRTLKSKNIRATVIIITQYGDLTIGGEKVKLSAAAPLLSRRYGQDVIGGVLYKYRSPSNHPKLVSLLKRIP